MRKLRTFYGKVTEFLNDDKIAYLQRLDVIVIIKLYRRVEQTVYLYNQIGYLCRRLPGCRELALIKTTLNKCYELL